MGSVHFHGLDWTILAAYFALVTWIGHRVRGRQDSAYEYFMAGYVEGQKWTEREPWTGQRVSAGLVYVNVYLVHRAYGGPEEGGWWYDAGELVETRTCSNTELLIKEMVDELTKDYDADKPRYHYNGTWATVRVEERPSCDFPATRPRYE